MPSFAELLQQGAGNAAYRLNRTIFFTDFDSYLTGGAGLMLGVADRAEYTASSEHLEAGCAVLLYSDGLVEDRRRSLGEGLEALAGAFRDGGQVTAAEMCATAQATMVEGQVRADDVCLLAVQLVK